jgi:hypothetical protein
VATSASSGGRPPSYLRLLQNRYDDEALVSVLASPFVGVSNDALLLIRRAAGRSSPGSSVRCQRISTNGTSGSSVSFASATTGS